MMRGEDLPVVGGFFGREIRGDHTVGAASLAARAISPSHLQDGI